MAAAVALPTEEFFSERYLDAFYEAHVASSRSRGSGNLDEDIAAIEAEIKKVQHYRSECRSYRVDQKQKQSQLNSCGNSECSDDEEVEDASPTSVFKVCCSEGGTSPLPLQKSPDIFTWAATQQVQHDHNYCCEMSTSDTQSTAIDHGTVNITNIKWQELSPAKRIHTIQRLSCILQQKPSGRHSPTFSSLDWLPNSLANWIRKTGTLGILHASKEDPTVAANPAPSAAQKTHSCSNTTTKTSLRRLGNIELRSHSGIQLAGSTKPVIRHRRKQAPYGKSTRQLNIEVTRVRNASSCSEEDSVIID